MCLALCIFSPLLWPRPERVERGLGRVAPINRPCGPWTCGVAAGKIVAARVLLLRQIACVPRRPQIAKGIGMSQLLRTATVITRVAIALMIVMLALGAAGATSAPSKKEDCSWGASSVTAWVDADGFVRQTAPATTGCIP